MRILTNELRCAKLLRRSGIKASQANSIMSMISEMQIHNIYSKDEVNNMLSETVEKVFSEHERGLKQHQREFDEKMAIINKQVDRQYDELKASRRWVIGTIITVGMGLAAYLSALIKLYH